MSSESSMTQFFSSLAFTVQCANEIMRWYS